MSSPAADKLRAAVRSVIENLEPVPACVQNSRYDILAYNRTYGMLLCDLDAVPPENRNCMILCYTNDEWRSSIVHLEDAQRRLKLSKRQWENRAFPEAYLEAQRALRPVRILMRAFWEKAARDLDVPTASPYALSFYTLPRHYRFWDQLRGLRVSANLLPDSGFEVCAPAPRCSLS